MTTVLIVDDSLVDRKLAGACLRDGGLDVVLCANGSEALELIRSEPPDIVLTDLQMPEMDGLQLVQKIKAVLPALPVILMTAHGSEEIAVAALKAGAASYVPKANLRRDLNSTVHSVLSILSTQRAELQLMSNLRRVELHFEIGNELAALRPLVLHMQGYLRQLNLVDQSELVRVSTALQEALINSIEHGNLELDSSLRELRDDTYWRQGNERRRQTPYKDRRVFVSAVFTPDEARWTLRDEGPGFNPQTLPDPTDPANLDRCSGRGLLLIRTFMDEVSFNENGTEIRMLKRSSAATRPGP